MNDKIPVKLFHKVAVVHTSTWEVPLYSTGPLTPLLQVSAVSSSSPFPHHCLSYVIHHPDSSCLFLMDSLPCAWLLYGFLLPVSFMVSDQCDCMGPHSQKEPLLEVSYTGVAILKFLII